MMTLINVLEYIDNMDESQWEEFVYALHCRGIEIVETEEEDGEE